MVDIAWAANVKMSAGSRFGWTAAPFVLPLPFIVPFGRALQVLRLRSAYAVRTGIGAIGSVALGILVFREMATAARLIWIAVTLVGIVGPKTTNM